MNTSYRIIDHTFDDEIIGWFALMEEDQGRKSRDEIEARYKKLSDDLDKWRGDMMRDAGVLAPFVGIGMGLSQPFTSGIIATMEFVEKAGAAFDPDDLLGEHAFIVNRDTPAATETIDVEMMGHGSKYIVKFEVELT